MSIISENWTSAWHFISSDDKDKNKWRQVIGTEMSKKAHAQEAFWDGCKETWVPWHVPWKDATEAGMPPSCLCCVSSMQSSSQAQQMLEQHFKWMSEREDSLEGR